MVQIFLVAVKDQYHTIHMFSIPRSFSLSLGSPVNSLLGEVNK